MKTLAVAFLALALSGCVTGKQIVTRDKVLTVQVPEALYTQCPEVPRLPSLKNLTDIKVARLIVELHGNNAKCRAAIDSIKDYLNQAQQATNQP